MKYGPGVVVLLHRVCFLFCLSVLYWEKWCDTAGFLVMQVSMFRWRGFLEGGGWWLWEKVLHLNFFATFWSNSCLLRLENSSNLIKYPHLGITKPCYDFQGPNSDQISKRTNPIHFLLFLLPDIKHMTIHVSQTESNCQLKVHLTSLDDYFAYSLWIKLVLRSPK